MTTQTIPVHIIEYANKMIALGAKISFDQIVAMELKKEAKKGNGFASKKDLAKMESRKRVEEMTANIEHNPSNWLAEKNRENAIRNLPSSLR